MAAHWRLKLVMSSGMETQMTSAQIWVSTAEAEAAIGKSVDTLIRWANDERIPVEFIRLGLRGPLLTQNAR